MRPKRVSEQTQALWESEAAWIYRWVCKDKINFRTLRERLVGHAVGWRAGVNWAKDRDKKGSWVNYGPVDAPKQFKFVVNKQQNKNRKIK